jgi:ABC-type lipoprotein release transport system permease subunit
VRERSFWLRIGWRNLGRHRRRSVITAIALAWGFAAVVVLNGIMAGMGTDFIRSGTDLLAGQIRIQHVSYEPERDLWDVIGEDAGVPVAELLARVEADPDVIAAAPRVYGAGIVATDDISRGALLMGVDPERETRVTHFLRGLAAGALPAPGRNELVLGEELARQLRAGVGDVVVLVTPAADGSLGNELFTISGILRTGIPEIDAGQVVARLEDLHALLALPGDGVHEVVAAAISPWDAAAVAGRLSVALAGREAGLAIEAWTQFRPELLDFAALVSGANWVILIVIFLMAAFGVANTMLMGTFERRREFAVMKSLGMRPTHITGIVMAEALVLGALAVAAGSLIAAPFVLWLTYYPLDLTAVAGQQMFMDTLFRFVLRVEHSWAIPVRSAVALVVTAVLAALYPALRANRVPAAEALAGR